MMQAACHKTRYDVIYSTRLSYEPDASKHSISTFHDWEAGVPFSGRRFHASFFAPLNAPLWTVRAGQLIRQKTRRLAASRSSEDRQHAKSASFSAAAVDRALNRSRESCKA